MIKKYSFTRLKFILLIAFLFSSLHTFAKSINMYDSPEMSSKVIASIDLSKGIIPIYTPQHSEWIKIANPQNGEVGWVKLKDLNDGNMSKTVFSISQGADDKRAITYQSMQFGQMNAMSAEEKKKTIEEIEKNELQLQKIMQNMQFDLSPFFHDIHFYHDPMPYFVPIFIMPVREHHDKTTPHKETSTINEKK